MADYRLAASEILSEERTEPFSQSEIDARFRGVGVEEPVVPVDIDTVPLDILQIEEHHHKQGIRILVRPLTRTPNTRSASDNCQWLALRAEVASSEKPEHKVLAVTQTSRDIKFSVRIPGEVQDDLHRPPLWCELYYDPTSEEVIFLNKSDVPISLCKVSQSLLASPPLNGTHPINPLAHKALRPGTWRIRVRDIDVLDFRVLEKRPTSIYQPLSSDYEDPSSSVSSDQLKSSGKRSLDAGDEDDAKRMKRRMTSPQEEEDDGVVMFLGPTADRLVFPLPHGRESKQLSAVDGHALLDADKGDTVAVNGVCELDEYQLTKREPIASTALSSVYTATHSRVPNRIVTVKVLKTRTANPNEKPFVRERNVIRQADMWLRECTSQEDLQHESIVRYYGGDARFLSLYMEHVDAQDLTAAPRWRSRANDVFQGDRNDGLRILRDIASALSYLHSRRLVHNDIKPANILYSPERGAVLCDFGLSTLATNSPTSGGTPYYVPPEFIERKLRGPPSDVWAMGITMLYVLHKIPFPDCRARKHHPRPLYWQIAGVNNAAIPHRQYGNGQSAASQMRDWLLEMHDAKEKLNSEDRLERLVKEMLTPNPNARITMARVLQKIGPEQNAPSSVAVKG